MLINILINAFFGFLALSLSGGVALHDSRLDKVFVTAASTDSSTHDAAHALAHDLHIHGNRHGAAETLNADPGIRERSHKRHTALHHSRFKLAALTA